MSVRLPFSNTTMLIVLGALALLWHFKYCTKQVDKFDSLSVENGNVTLIGSKMPASVAVGGMQPAALSVITETTVLPYYDPSQAEVYAEITVDNNPSMATGEAIATGQPMPVTTLPVQVPTYRVNIPTIQRVAVPNTGMTPPISSEVDGAPSPWASNLDGSLYFPFATSAEQAGQAVMTAPASAGPVMTIPATSAGAQSVSTTGAYTMSGSNMPQTPQNINVSFNAMASTDFPGNDMMCQMYDDGMTASACQEACKADPKCKGYADISPNTNAVFPQGFCCAKHTMVDPIQSGGVTSYAKMTMSPQ